MSLRDFKSQFLSWLWLLNAKMQWQWWPQLRYYVRVRWSTVHDFKPWIAITVVKTCWIIIDFNTLVVVLLEQHPSVLEANYGLWIEARQSTRALMRKKSDRSIFKNLRLELNACCLTPVLVCLKIFMDLIPFLRGMKAG